VHVVVMPGELTTAIGRIGDPEGVAELGLEGMRGVDRVGPISRPYKLASSELYHEGPDVLDIAGRTVGRGRHLLPGRPGRARSSRASRRSRWRAR
jgi:3-deoxy-7-phosphoheptulonate synthase